MRTHRCQHGRGRVAGGRRLPPAGHRHADVGTPGGAGPGARPAPVHCGDSRAERVGPADPARSRSGHVHDLGERDGAGGNGSATRRRHDPVGRSAGLVGRASQCAAPAGSGIGGRDRGRPGPDRGRTPGAAQPHRRRLHRIAGGGQSASRRSARRTVRALAGPAAVRDRPGHRGDPGRGRPGRGAGLRRPPHAGDGDPHGRIRRGRRGRTEPSGRDPGGRPAGRDAPGRPELPRVDQHRPGRAAERDLHRPAGAGGTAGPGVAVRRPGHRRTGRRRPGRTGGGAIRLDRQSRRCEQQRPAGGLGGRGPDPGGRPLPGVGGQPAHVRPGRSPGGRPQAGDRDQVGTVGGRAAGRPLAHRGRRDGRCRDRRIVPAGRRPAGGHDGADARCRAGAVRPAGPERLPPGRRRQFRRAPDPGRGCCVRGRAGGRRVGPGDPAGPAPSGARRGIGGQPGRPRVGSHPGPGRRCPVRAARRGRGRRHPGRRHPDRGDRSAGRAGPHRGRGRRRQTRRGMLCRRNGGIRSRPRCGGPAPTGVRLPRTGRGRPGRGGAVRADSVRRRARAPGPPRRDRSGAGGRDRHRSAGRRRR